MAQPKKTPAKTTAGRKTHKTPPARQTHKTPPARTAAKTCAYIDGNKAVASRQTPRGVQYLCEAHASQMARIGVTVEKL